MKPRSNRRWLLAGALLLAAFSLTQPGCGKFGAHSTVRKNFKFNGHWTVSARENAVTRSLDTTDDVVIANGLVTKFPAGALIKVSIVGDGPDRFAEYREKAGALELWVKESVQFRPGTPEDQAWVSQCLGELLPGNSSPEALNASALDESAALPAVLGDLEKASFSSRRKEVLLQLAARKELSPADQIALVESASRSLSFSSETREVLLKVIARPDFSSEAKPALLRAVDKLAFDSEKLEVQRALLHKDVAGAK